MHTVLVVDDEPGLAAVLSELLVASGYTAHIATDALAALAVMERHPIDVLLTDVRMFGHSGIWLAQEVAKRWLGTAIVLMTGFSSALDQVRDMPWPVLTKPSRFAVVKRAIEDALTARRT